MMTRVVSLRIFEVLDGFVGDDHHAAAGGFAASARSAHVQRLAGDDGGDGLPHVHGVGVHHPRHGLFVGVDVGRRNVFLGADELDQLGGVAAGHALQFAARHVLGIADDAALGAAEGNVHYGALPGHPTGQGADFIERDVGRVAHATLGRAARDGVLHAIAGEDFELTVVHHYRDVDDDFAVGLLQHTPQAFVEIELVGGDVEPRRLLFPGIRFLRMHCRGCHKVSDNCEPSGPNARILPRDASDSAVRRANCTSICRLPKASKRKAGVA